MSWVILVMNELKSDSLLLILIRPQTANQFVAASKQSLFDVVMFSSRQLDEQLQRQFKKYLDARGINEDLSNYLLDLLEDKEQREYQRWLHNVESFIRK